MGGGSSVNINRRVQSGYLDNIPYDLLVYAEGVNDSLQAISQTLYQAAINRCITHRDQNRPNADVLVLGPPNVGSTNTSYGTNIANYRTWAAAVVTAAGGATKGVYYCDTSAAYTAVDSTVYCEASAAAWLHPNVKGQGLLADTIMSTVQTTRFYASL